MDISAITSSDNYFTNADPLVTNKAPVANLENVAQVSENLKFDDSIDLSATANAIVEWVNSYKTTFGSNIGTISYLSSDSEVGVVLDKKILEANQNLLNYLEGASIQEKSSKQYQDYVNKLRVYIAKIQAALEQSEGSLNEKNPEPDADNEPKIQAQNDNSTTKTDNSLIDFLQKSIGEFRDKLKEFLLSSEEKPSKNSSEIQ